MVRGNGNVVGVTIVGEFGCRAKGLAKRVIACLDVRSNDAGDLVVTKGDSYDVREKSEGESGDVRNLGKPVELAKKYFDMGADEVSFLNITGYPRHAIERCADD